MQGKMHHIRSLTPLQATGNALAMHVHNSGPKGLHNRIWMWGHPILSPVKNKMIGL